MSYGDKEVYYRLNGVDQGYRTLDTCEVHWEEDEDSLTVDGFYISISNRTSSYVSVSYTAKLYLNGSLAATISGTGSTSYQNSFVNKGVSLSKSFAKGHSSTTVSTKVEVSGTATNQNGNSWNYSGSVQNYISVGERTQYSVSYNANGGSGAPNSQVKWHGEELTLTSSKPTRANYAFWHWNTKTDNTGTSYDSGGKYTGNGYLTLYAIWNPIVTYNANGGTNAPAAQTKTYGSALSLTTAKPTRAGYVFKEWNTSSDGTGTSYASGGSYSVDSPVTLYAVWNPGVTYDANGGTGAPSPQVKTYGTPVTVSQPGSMSRSGYEFVTWNTAKDGTGTTYAPGSSYTSESSVTLYAVWRKLPEPPTVSSMLVTRTDGSGSITDDGTYMTLTAEWSVDNVNTSGNTGVVTGAYKPSTSSSWTSFPITSGASGASGTATALVAGLDTDTQYDVRVTVTDRDGRVTTRLDILTRAKFVWDVKAGGEAMGIGSAAPQNGLEVGWETQFDQLVKMLEDLEIGGDLSVGGTIDAPQFDVVSTSTDVATASSGWTVSSQAGRSVGHARMVAVAFKPTAAVEANSQKTIGTLSSNWRPSLNQGFCDAQGIGSVSSGGSISYRNIVALSTSSTVYVCLTFLK